jgi:tetratricopeptide (TPR) repeat protein
MYFMNQTGDKSLDHWREALPLWIITDLSQSRYIKVLAADRLYSILRGLNLLETRTYASEDLRSVAEEGGVNHIFQASYSKTGDIFRIDYSLKRADSLEIITSDHLIGQSEESFHSLVDDITKKIKANLELSEGQLMNDFDNDASNITTGSPEAFKYYSIGRKYLSQGDNRRSIELMEQAVAVDPEFAMAYRSMAGSLQNLGYLAKAKEFYLKAFEYRDRLSERERYRIEADYYKSEEKLFAKAFEPYEKLLEIYPDDFGARHNLALLYTYIEEYQKAIEHYEINIKKYRSSFTYTHTNLAYVYQSLGFYDKALETIENYIDNFSDNALVHQVLSNIYRHQERYDLVLEEVDKAFALAPTDWINLWLRGDTYYYMADLEKAEEEYRKLLEKEEHAAFVRGTLRMGQLSRLKGRFKDSIEWQEIGIKKAEEFGEKTWTMNRTLIMADMDITLGHPEEALKKIDYAWKIAVEEERLPYQRRVLNLRALAYLGMNRIADSQRTADELKSLINQSINKNLIRSYYHLRGRIELAKSCYPGAIAFLEKCPQLVYPTSDLQMIYADSLGLAYFQSGDLEKAREEYQRIRSLQGRFEYGNIYVKSFYMLGKIYEQQGDTAKAIEHYEKFLDLWKDADPGIAEVDDTRERLAEIKSKISD